MTQANTADAQTAFLAGLAALPKRPGAHLVVTVRADAEPLLHQSALAPRWDEARFVVPGLSRDELREIIQRPASTAVLHFEPTSSSSA